MYIDCGCGFDEGLIQSLTISLNFFVLVERIYRSNKLCPFSHYMYANPLYQVVSTLFETCSHNETSLSC